MATSRRGLRRSRGGGAGYVEVTNSWFNRLVGDQQPGATPIASVQPPLKNIAAGTELKPAGLLGPVRLFHRA